MAAATEDFASWLMQAEIPQSRLTPHLAAFRAAHPKIVVELVIDNRVLDLSRRQADIALRPMRPTEGNLWGRKLSDVAWTFYAAPALIEHSGGPIRSADQAERLPLIGWGEDTSGIKAADWLVRTTPAAAVVYRTSSLVNQAHAARAGIGVARNETGNLTQDFRLGFVNTFSGATRDDTAFALMAGVGIPYPGWTLDLGYRYVDLRPKKGSGPFFRRATRSLREKGS